MAPVAGKWSVITAGVMANELSNGPEVAHYVGKDTATAKWVMCIDRREHFSETALRRLRGIGTLRLYIAAGAGTVASSCGARDRAVDGAGE